MSVALAPGVAADPITQPALSVVIPAYQEAGRLGATLERIVAYLEPRPGGFEVVVVDDGSRDGTAEVAAAHPSPAVRAVRLSENRGKGAAVRRGVAESRGERVLLCDADLSAPIEDLPLLEAALDSGADLALGSRALPSSRLARRQPFYRERMGKIFNLLVRLLVVGGYRDTQCGFKLIAGEAARDVCGRMVIDGFAYDVELVWLARRLGYRVAEVGVRWSDSPGSRVHPVRDSATMLRDLLRMRWHHRGGLSRPAGVEIPGSKAP